MAKNKIEDKVDKKTEFESSFADGSFLWFFVLKAILDGGKNDTDERLKKLEAKVDMLEKFM